MKTCKRSSFPFFSICRAGTQTLTRSFIAASDCIILHCSIAVLDNLYFATRCYG